MRPLLLLSVLVILAFLGGIYLFGRRGKFSFYTGGIEFLLIGAVLVGPSSAFGISREMVEGLFPFIHIELGWIGLIYGIQMDWHHLRRHPAADWIVVLAESGSALLAVFVAAWLGLALLLPESQAGRTSASVLLAAAASLSSPWALGVVGNVIGARSALLRKLRFIVGLDDGPGLAVFGMMFLTTIGFGFIDASIRFIATLFLGVLLGWFTVHMIRWINEDYDILLILLGVVLMASGAAHLLGMTVLLITVLAGMIVANVRPRVRDIYPIVVVAEHPFYLLFLMLAGALWDPTDFRALILALILAAVRLGAKWVGLEATRTLMRRHLPRWGGRVAPALFSPGGIAIAMVVNFALFQSRFPLAQFALNTTAWVLVILNPLGVTMARRALARSGVTA